MDIYKFDEPSAFLRLLSPDFSLIAQACAVEYFRRLLVQNHCPPPHIVDQLIKELIRCLGINFGEIQRDAAWALTNCACSPHQICQKIIDFGGLDALLKCTIGSIGEVRDQALWTIGNLASDCELCKQKVRDSAALQIMISLLIDHQLYSSKWKGNLIWSLSQVLRGGIQSLSPPYIRSALDGLKVALEFGDKRIKIDALWCIAYIADDINTGRQIQAVISTDGLIEKIVALLKEPDFKTAALRVIGNLMTGDDAQTQTILDSGVLPELISMFQNDSLISQKREVAWILSNIAAGSAQQIEFLFKNGNLIELLMKASTSSDLRTKKETGWIVANALTGGSVKHTRLLCCRDILSVIVPILECKMDTRLVERFINALELLIRDNPNFIFLIEKLRILSHLRAITESDQTPGTLLTVRVSRLINEEEKWRQKKAKPAMYEIDTNRLASDMTTIKLI